MTEAPPWPPDLDAVVAAPNYHSVLFENDLVRVLENIVPRGHTVPLHTHCWPSTLYFFGWSHIIRRDAAGAILMDSRDQNPPPPGTVRWSPVMPPHTLENVGDSDLKIICVEVKTF